MTRMAIIPWRPFWELERWFEQEWPEIFELEFFRFPRIRMPRMDIYETKDKVVVEAELPGVDPKNIDIEIKDNMLKLEARAKEVKEEKGKGYYKRETGARYFKRIVPLPGEVEEAKAEAEYENGILRIEIPKKAPKKEKEKKIKIKVKKSEK